METTTQEQAVTPAQEPVIETPKEEIDVQAQIKAEVEKIQEKYKKELAGLNQANSKLQNEMKQKELEKLSEEERLKAEIELARQEKEAIEKETQNIKRERLIDKALFDSGLPGEFAKRINGDSEESILEDVKAFKDFIEQEAEKRKEKIMNGLLGGQPPEAGVAVSGSERSQLIAQYNEAEKNGEAAKMMALKDQIRKLPKE